MKTFKEFLKEIHYWGKEAAGTIFIANDTKRILFLQRSGEEDSEQGQWEITIGGKKDEADIFINVTRDREADEELGVTPDVLDTKSIEIFYDTSDNHEPFRYYVFVKIVSREFVPKLSEEHSAYKWVNILIEELPSPLHFGAERLIKSPRILELIKNENI